MSKKLIFLLLAAVWVAMPSAVASLKYDTLTSADGLSNSSVNCIYQDSTLMMWFGTWDGLNAYNGYGFRTYKFAPDNANTISNNVIRNIVEEAKGILWVATDYGINRIDVENDRIERFYPGYEDNGPTAEQVFSERNDKIDYMVGTMIEVPRAAVTANQIAEVAEFFSFGTNDLTQMTLGFSRDDIGKFLPVYLEKGILKNDPFQILDQNGVGQLIREAVFKGRGTRPTLKCGICGEHGGEPSSVEFCHYAGLNYVSCSPFRVPIARLAAAHAALNEK